MKHYRSIMFIFLFVAFPLGTEAQPGNIALGDKVKINAPSLNDSRIVGWVDDVSSFGMLVSSGDKRITIPYNTIQTIHVSRGKRRRWILGFALGSISGALVGSLFTKEPPKCNSGNEICLDFTGLENIQKVSTGALIGTIVGTSVGLAIKTDCWERISVDVAFNQPVENSDSYTLNPSVSFRIPLGRRHSLKKN